MKIQLESFTDKHKEKIWRDGFLEESPEWAIGLTRKLDGWK